MREMEANLPVEEQYKNFKRGFESPISVGDQIHGGGDSNHGIQTIAFNLPNDERVREAKGAKKVILQQRARRQIRPHPEADGRAWCWCRSRPPT